MTTRLLTDVEVAELLQLDVDTLHRLRHRHGWPCVKFSRREWRFTEAQVEQIIATQTQAPDRGKRLTSTAGLTARSAAHRSRKAREEEGAA